MPSEHGLEFVKERKLEALQSTFKQKNVEIRTLKLEAAKEKFESHNSQAALSAFSRQWDLLNQELSTMADRLGIDTAQLSSGAQATTSILTEYFNAGSENGEAHVTNFCTKLHYIKQTLGIRTADDDDDDDDDDDGAVNAGKGKKGKKGFSR